MKWLIIPWLIVLALLLTYYVAVGDWPLAFAATSLPALIAATVTARVIYTYRRWIADQAAEQRQTEAMAWNLPEPDQPANQNRPISQRP